MISSGQRQKHLLNQTYHSQNLSPFVVFGLPEHCTNFQFPPPPSVLRHRRDISTFLDNLMVYTMKTIYVFLIHIIKADNPDHLEHLDHLGHLDHPDHSTILITLTNLNTKIVR